MVVIFQEQECREDESYETDTSLAEMGFFTLGGGHKSKRESVDGDFFSPQSLIC